MKAVIPVAGLGTRMLPATKSIPKEMLPVVDKPLIQHIVSEATSAGIKEIILVTHSSKQAIENHFGRIDVLETTLMKSNKHSLLDEVRSICPQDVTISTVFQEEAKGLADAILCAKPLVGNEDFVVMLPDVLIDCYQSNQESDNLPHMIDLFKSGKGNQVMVEQVHGRSIEQYGVVNCGGVNVKTGEYTPISQIVEKPSLENAPSDLAVVGRYVFSKTIWDLLERTPVADCGEVVLTDTIELLMEEEDVCAYNIIGQSHDCGSKAGLVKANIHYALNCHSMGAEIRHFLKTTEF